jgi:hypothetical protein
MKLPLCCLSLLLVVACGSEKTPSGSNDSGQSSAADSSVIVDSGVNGSVDSGVSGNVDTGVANPADTGVANPADTGVANPADTGVANPADTGVAPTDTGVAPADSGVVDLPDAGSMTDAGPGICVPPAGYTGNSKNVGAACTPGGGECRQYSFAGLCSIDLDPRVTTLHPSAAGCARWPAAPGAPAARSTPASPRAAWSAISRQSARRSPEG